MKTKQNRPNSSCDTVAILPLGLTDTLPQPNRLVIWNGRVQPAAIHAMICTDNHYQAYYAQSV